MKYFEIEEKFKNWKHEPTVDDLFEKGGIVNDNTTLHSNEPILNSRCLNIPISLACSNEDASLGKIGDKIKLTGADYKRFFEDLKTRNYNYKKITASPNPLEKQLGAFTKE